MVTRLAFSFLLSGLIVSSAYAAQNPKAQNRGLIPGYVAKDNINKVNSGLNWNTNLNHALDQARAQGKMVFWVHLVGKMEGAT
ncbi:MAG: hypothetical protein K2Z81_10045 [Cyanobacteria bacterium]|nr:hypothetical protein [Cyanobacteriota bacterium]